MEDRTCSIDGCSRGGKITRGWCRPHYLRWHRNGDPLGGIPASIGAESCTIDGCDSPVKVKNRGWCSAHYQRWQAYGAPEAGKPDRYFSPEDRWSAWTERRGECLIWIGAGTPKGYGQLTVDSSRMNAHRYAWIRAHGPISSEMVVDHRFHCDRRCVEVAHLRLITPGENNWNRKGPNSDSSTGVRNVGFYKGRYQVRVKRDGVTHYGGRFRTLEDAADAASRLRADLYGNFAGRG